MVDECEENHIIDIFLFFYRKTIMKAHKSIYDLILSHDNIVNVLLK